MADGSAADEPGQSQAGVGGVDEITRADRRWQRLRSRRRRRHDRKSGLEHVLLQGLVGYLLLREQPLLCPAELSLELANPSLGRGRIRAQCREGRPAVEEALPGVVESAEASAHSDGKNETHRESEPAASSPRCRRPGELERGLPTTGRPGPRARPAPT